MVSFDVESLFTNLPLDETINICLDLLYEGKEFVEGMTREEFKKLLELATSYTLILFNGEYYKQVDGVSMGSPLYPILADVFLCYMEKKWLEECPESFKPIHYHRYVDDIFMTFKSPLQVEQFLHYVNSRHKNIRFTSEEEKDNKLSFLDILIIKVTLKVLFRPNISLTLLQHCFIVFITLHLKLRTSSKKLKMLKRSW